MKTFRCSSCGGIAFFDDTVCVACGHRLAFAPERRDMVALAPASDDAWRIVGDAQGTTVRLCRNVGELACNQVLHPGAPPGLCNACLLTRTIPNLDRPGHREAWGRLERTKRRLLWTLQGLGLQWRSREEDPEHGLVFEFLSDADLPDGERASTGHTEGHIVINADEADDAVLARQRQDLREPYRTLIGHLRHEAGHYYWNVLIRDRGREEAFRTLFGDEGVDYAESLRNYYGRERPADWREHYISEYATMHPWEDWAESFAHYLHMVDGVETGLDLAVALAPRNEVLPALDLGGGGDVTALAFDELLRSWGGLSIALNQFNRGMGVHDAYPFAPSVAALEKIRFVDQEVRAARSAGKGGGRA
ncbi:MAG TPA: putative zinc-binding metallopeptidase [Casimicrobiaceae bacterium]